MEDGKQKGPKSQDNDTDFFKAVNYWLCASQTLGDCVYFPVCLERKDILLSSVSFFIFSILTDSVLITRSFGAMTSTCKQQTTFTNTMWAVIKQAESCFTSCSSSEMLRSRLVSLPCFLPVVTQVPEAGQQGARVQPVVHMLMNMEITSQLPRI